MANTKPKRSRKKPEGPEIRRMGRRTTGRNIAFNQTVTADTANLFYDLQRKMDVPMGEVLERAAEALQSSVRHREGLQYTSS
jgi:hypothetical protein